MRTQENHDIFREKLSVTASLQLPRRCHGALMAFYRVPTVFMVEILCALTVLNCPSTALTAHAPHFHGVATALRTQWHLQERRTVSLQTPRTTTAFAQRPLCVPTELLLRRRRPYCVAMVTLRCPLCALLGRRVTVIVLSMLKMRTIARCSMRPKRVQWRCHCIAAVVLAFVLRAPRHSAIC